MTRINYLVTYFRKYLSIVHRHLVRERRFSLMYAYFGATNAVRMVVGPKRLYENNFAFTEFLLKKKVASTI